MDTQHDRRPPSERRHAVVRAAGKASAHDHDLQRREDRSGSDRDRDLHRDGDEFVVAATKGGADEHPAWYHNLVAHPEATFEAAADTFQVVARETTGDERQRLYDEHARLYPEFAAYPSKTSRVIPVLALVRRAG